MTEEASISILVDDRTITCAPGATLLNVLQAHAIAVQTAYGGRGICHLCRVTVAAGREALPPPSSVEKRALGNVLIAQGMRLSCQITASPGLHVRVPRIESPEEREERIRRARERLKR